MDKYEDVRRLPFQAAGQALGVDLALFKFADTKQDWVGPCPLCRPKKNRGNFRYNVDGRWHCFSCNAHGKGMIDLTMGVRQVGFQEAVETQKPFAGSPIQAVRLPAPVREQTPLGSENPAFSSTYDKYAVPSPWLAQRGFLQETLDRFGVFQYENPNRISAYRGKIMFPIRRLSDGELVGYLARTPNPGDGEPKYLLINDN
jgi:DNA primase